MGMTHLQLRKLFSDFWESHDHKEVPPIPLVPQNDPTTLFTGSGMQQLVPYLLGEPHPLGKKLYNIQPCIRVQDIEEVGDNRHDTFFEMMGNWSLGTYFKKEQLAWFWEFLTKYLQLPKERLYVSVFEGNKIIPPDEESYGVWKKLGLSEDKIKKYDATKNWWSRAGVPENMPAGEPGGPDSEVFYEFTDVKHDPKYGKECHPNCDCGRFLEIGNSVFMQYKKMPDGTFQELPNKNVDFGGGLERLLSAANNEPDMFKTDVFISIIRIIEKITNKSYEDEIDKPTIRIIADHIKTAVFLIKNGVYPSNKEQGYVLRRLLRRASLKFHMLGVNIQQIFSLKEICKSVVEIYQNVYFEQKDVDQISPIIQEEMDKFGKTIARGLTEILRTPDNELENKAFYFYQSYGLPIEILEEILKDQNKKVNKNKFRSEFEKHKNLSRTASAGKFKGGLADHSEQTLKYHTATHLLHQALFDVLGNDIRQEGSNITVERLRFDFYCGKKPTDEEINKVGKIVNEKIDKSLPVSFKIMQKEEAMKLGARSFFREKYPDMVKVYSVGDYSNEFCGGPHVTNTKDIGKIEIYKFEKIGSNLYRVYAK